MLSAVWLLAYPVFIYIALRIRSDKPVDESIWKTFWVTLVGAALTFLLAAITMPNINFGGSQSARMSWDISHYFFVYFGPELIGAFTAVFIARAGGIARALLATGFVALWSLAFWGILIYAYVDSFGETPFIYGGG